MKNTKIKLVGFTFLEYGLNRFFLDFFKKKYEIVEKNWDLIFCNCFYYQEVRKKYPDSKILVFSGENIFRKDKIRKGRGYLKKIGLHNTFFEKLLPLIKLRPYLALEKSVQKDKNTFFILCNALKKDNIFNIPYFLDTHFLKKEHFINIKKEHLYSEKTKFCAFIVANENAKDRISFFKKLSKYKKVDSYGPVLNNAKIPWALLKKYKRPGITEEALRQESHNAILVSDAYKLNSELFREYKFVICFENSYANDYITEKLPNVMLGNAIGIYRGAGNVGEFFNTKSFLNWDDFGSDEKVIERIIELDKDHLKYQKMLKAPFFVKNELPPCVKNLEKDLEKFLEKILEK